MAKAPKRILTKSVVGFLYETVSDLPWDEVEDAVRGEKHKDRPQFSDQEKHEIFLSTNCFAEALSEASGGLPAKDLEEARSEISKALVSVHATLAKYLEAADDEKEARSFEDLQMIYNTEDLDVRKSLDLICRNATILEHTFLEDPESVENEIAPLDSSQRQPETIALETFIQDVLFKACKIPARSNPGYLETPQLHEFVRWGIPIGPRSKPFRHFVNALLQRDFSEDRIRDSYREIRDDGFETFEELVQGKPDGGK